MNDALEAWNRRQQEPRPIVDWVEVQRMRDYHAKELARLDALLDKRPKEGK